MPLQTTAYCDNYSIAAIDNIRCFRYSGASGTKISGTISIADMGRRSRMRRQGLPWLLDEVFLGELAQISERLLPAALLPGCRHRRAIRCRQSHNRLILQLENHGQNHCSGSSERRNPDDRIRHTAPPLCICHRRRLAAGESQAIRAWPHYVCHRDCRAS